MEREVASREEQPSRVCSGEGFRKSPDDDMRGMTLRRLLSYDIDAARIAGNKTDCLLRCEKYSMEEETSNYRHHICA